MFSFNGTIDSSKSLMNRALIVKSFFPEVIIEGQSKADDVRYLETAIEHFLSNRNEFYVGEAGTGLRFLSYRVSKTPGEYIIKAHARLLTRPIDDLILSLSQLGVNSYLSENGFHIISPNGWVRPKKPIYVNGQKSSQFLSGLALSCWQNSFDLEIAKSGLASQSYWQMTVLFLNKLGLKIQETADSYLIKSNQTLAVDRIFVEPDMSSVAALFMAAAIDGNIKIQLPESSLQPDFNIIEILKSMRASIHTEGGFVTVSPSLSLNVISLNCSNTPDLVPCLSVLCLFAKGQSRLTGLANLKHKESHRLKNTVNLIKLAGGEVEFSDDELIIKGRGRTFVPTFFEWDPDQDHRMAMAAALLKLVNPEIVILNSKVVTKSFPDFFKILS